VKSTIHWVPEGHALAVQARLYDRLFTKKDINDIGEGEDFISYLNPSSMEILTGCMAEPGLDKAKAGEVFQFERNGYFCVDPDSGPGNLIFNRTVTLRDSWAKVQASQSSDPAPGSR